MKKSIVLILLSCFTFLSFAGKTPSKEELQKAFKAKGKWCFFTTAQKSIRNRLTYFNKNTYKICKEGDLFKKVLYKDKYYASDLNNNIYKPHWQMKQDFGEHLVPAKKYIVSLNNKIKSSKKAVGGLGQKSSKKQKELDYSKKRYDFFSEYKKYKTGYGRYGSKIKAKVKYFKKAIKEQEDSMEELTKQLNDSKNELQKNEEFKVKVYNLYKQHVKTKK